MTNPPPSPQPSRRDPDELIAVVVAFATIGTILFWGLSRTDDSFNFLGALAPTTESASDPDEEGNGFLGLGSEPLLSGDEPESDRRIAPAATVGVAAGISSFSSNAGGVPATGLTTDPTTEATIGVAPVPIPLPDEDEASPVPTTSPTTDAAGVPEPTAPPESPNADVSFPDVPSSYWAYPFITELARRGIVSGKPDGTFQPDQPLTRAEYAALVATLFDETRADAIAFKDVATDYWAAEPIDTAVKTRFLRGYPNQEFRPDQQIPRYQVLLSLVSGFNIPDAPSLGVVVSGYRDAAQIPQYAIPAIAAATQARVPVNYPDPTVLQPDRQATRAEVAAMIYQALVTAGQLDPIESQYISQP